ncbi:MAG: hypothetical protein EB833_04845 [Thaumarchaeota archaeon S13]|nr:MAG: hypothetical protein EB833_04845 [Thaumarchaeota archaeon S13]
MRATAAGIRACPPSPRANINTAARPRAAAMAAHAELAALLSWSAVSAAIVAFSALAYRRYRGRAAH